MALEKIENGENRGKSEKKHESEKRRRRAPTRCCRQEVASLDTLKQTSSSAPTIVREKLEEEALVGDCSLMRVASGRPFANTPMLLARINEPPAAGPVQTWSDCLQSST